MKVNGKRIIGVSEHSLLDWPVYDVEVELEDGSFAYGSMIGADVFDDGVRGIEWDYNSFEETRPNPILERIERRDALARHAEAKANLFE